jgi:hypothetical protein
MDTLLPTTKHYPRSRWILIAVLAGICVIAYTLIIIYGFNFFSGKNAANPSSKFLASTQSSVSGTIDLNGTPPAGATIAIGAKQNGQQSYTTVVSNIGAVDGAVWSWNEAKPNTEYIFVAYLQVNGQTIATSDKLVLIAPADSESLRINVPKNPTSSSSSIQSAISGSLNLNGYIPPNSTITIATRPVGGTQFSNVVTNLPAIDNGIWSWTSATQNTQYEIQATLLVNGASQNQSQVLTVTAPATNEVLTINSSAQPPAPAVTGISGTININGTTPPSGSYITLGVRVTGTTQFTQIAGNISATDGVAWSYTNATAGTSYDIQAYLWQNSQPYSQSQILTVSAPATGEVLTINAATSPSSAPSNNSISVSCSSYNSSVNLWQITVNYNTNTSLPNAQQYMLYVGTNQGGNQQVNITTTASSTNSSQSYVSGNLFTTGTTYYAQYAYATCSNCSSFSSFSSPVTFACNFSATPTPTNTPSPTPTNTPIPTPTNTPIPTPTNTPIPTPTNTPVPPTNAP